MKYSIAIMMILILAGCGYSSKDNEVVGQVKKVIKKTPILCPDRLVIDLSLGVMRNGTGSLSQEDAFIYVPNASDLEKITAAAESGKLVKVKYDTVRFTICHENRVLRAIELID